VSDVCLSKNEFITIYNKFAINDAVRRNATGINVTLTK